MILSPFTAFVVATITMLLPLAWYARKNPAPNKGLGVDFSNPIYIFSLLYFLSFYVGFIGLNLWHVPRFLNKPFSYENDLITLWLSVFAYLFFMFGFYVADKMPNISLLGKSTKILTPKLIFYVLLCMTLLKLGAYIWFFRISPSLPTAQLSFFYGKGYIVFLFSFFIWFCMVLLIVKLFLEEQKKVFIFYTVVLILANMLMFNFLDGSRRYFIMPIMLIVILAYLKDYIKNKQMVISATVLLAILIFLRLNQGIFYDVLHGEDAKNIVFWDTQRVIYTLANSFDSFWHSSNVLFKYPIEQYPFGVVGIQSLTDIFASYIPRAIWAGKPDIYGDMLLQNMLYPELYAQSGFNCARFPIGFIGYAVLSFGIVGLILFPLLTGAFYGFLNKFKLTSTLSLALFLWFFGEAFNIIRSGFILGLLQQLVGIAMSIAILYAVLICLKALNIVYKTVFAKNG